MEYPTIRGIVCVILLSLFTFQVNAEGLTEYLKNPEATTAAPNNSPADKPLLSSITELAIAEQTEGKTSLKNIIELVVAGIVASALIIVVLVMFLGRWLAGREKRIIKELRISAEEDTDQITSTINYILDQEKETRQITQTMRSESAKLIEQKEDSVIYSEEIAKANLQVKAQEKELSTISDNVSQNMQNIQKYWDSQVNETVDTLSLFQHNLSQNMDSANNDLEKISEKKEHSELILQDMLKQYNNQSSLLESNADVSKKVSSNLDIAYKESNNLIESIKKQQELAERTLKDYSQRLSGFEEQAYEQFDASFQVADLARQELSANLDENRKHIETMRRQEEQSHGINNQIVKNLETLDYSKILKISQTLDTTQDMFDEIHHKVDETRVMLEELKQIEEDIRQTASNVKDVAKSHVTVDESTAQLDQLIATAENKLNRHRSFNEETMQDALAEVDHDRTDAQSEPEDIVAANDMTNDSDIEDSAEEAENLSEDIRDNTTIAITDYKLASGDTSTPLSFFRDIQRNNANKS